MPRVAQSLQANFDHTAFAVRDALAAAQNLRRRFGATPIMGEALEAFRYLTMYVGSANHGTNVEFLDDIEYAGLTKEQLLKAAPENYSQTFIFIVDQMTVVHPEHPILVVDLYEGTGNGFRAVPSQIQGIENNLSIANMD